MNKLGLSILNKLGILLCGFVCSASVADYSEHSLASSFITTMTSENVPASMVRSLLAEAQRQEPILDAIARPAEKTKPWYLYRPIFLDEKRIHAGVQFWRSNITALNKVSRQFGVPAEIIVAIIGVETRYGRVAGSYRVLDALATLGFDYPARADFFRKELKHFIILTDEQNLDPTKLLGSYAGAMGLAQFMPSSFRRYAVDFDSDDTIDIWTNTSDAIGSVGHYLKAHGWQENQAVIEHASIENALVLATVNDEVFNQLTPPHYRIEEIRQMGLRYGKEREQEHHSSSLEAVNHDRFQPYKVALSEDQYEYWIAHPNFYVLTRYNHSHMYALAVFQLSQEIKSIYDRSLYTP